MREDACVRLVLLAELRELERLHREAPARTGPEIARRVALAHRRKDAERELERFDARSRQREGVA